MDPNQQSSLFDSVVADATRTIEGIRDGASPRRSVGAYERQRLAERIREKASLLERARNGAR